MKELSAVRPPLSPLFRSRMRNLLGAAEGDSLCDALDTESPAAVRLNPRKPVELPPEIAAGTPVSWCPAHGLLLPRRPSYALMPQWHAGAFYVQEPASMVMETIASELACEAGTPALRWLDMCAAPGGKTTAALAGLPDEALVVANEYDTRRAAVLAENLARWGAPNVVVTRGGTERFRRMPEAFHVVAVDAPCSGEGMMRKEEVARTQWSDALVEQCAALQRQILADAWEALAPGGTLIYSTCTFNRRENEDNIRLLIDTLGAENRPMPASLRDCGALPALDADLHALRFMPHATCGEGLFIALLRKPGSLTYSAGQTLRQPRKGKKKTSSESKTAIDKDTLARAAALLRPDAELQLTADSDGTISAIAAHHASFAAAIASRCSGVMTAGVEVASVKGRDLIPSPRLALSTVLAPDAFPALELTREEALDYLRRGTSGVAGALAAADSAAPRGYMAVRHTRLTLGWLKNIGARVNNLYPQAWRLRMD